jgi:predicted DNA-binding transcriptional regulator AlpA
MGAPPFLLGPFLLRDVPTVFFGDGDTGKSYALTAMALSVATGQAILPGVIPVGGGCPVLYCDYEDSQSAFDDRCARLLAGAKCEWPGPLHYLEARHPLPDMVAELRVQIAHLGIRLLVIDSFGYACGPEPETADAAMRVYRAIRSLGPVSCAIITHVSKAGMLARGLHSPYGSIHVRNSARMSWDVRSTQDDSEGSSKTIGFWCDKHNPLRARLAPVGYTISSSDSTTMFVPCSVPRSPDQLVPTSAASEIMAYIREHRLVTNREIAQTTGLSEKTVDRTCRRLQDRHLIDQLPRPDGTPRSTPIQWFWTGSEELAPTDPEPGLGEEP